VDAAAIMEAARRAVEQASPTAYALVFVAGALTGFNPCVYPTIPVIVGCVGGQAGNRGWRGLLLALAFVVGLALMYVVLGVTGSLVGSVLGLQRRTWVYIVGGVCVVAGLHLARLVVLPLPRLPASLLAGRRASLAGNLLLGALFGLVASPCALPIVGVIVALLASGATVVYGATLMFVYALGHGLPLVVVGAVTGALVSLAPVARWAGLIQQISGWILILAGLFLIWAA
jgi:cytochrome c-type biogenesis protein